MRVSNDIKKCVVFVGSKKEKDYYDIIGTAFPLFHRAETADLWRPYIATARHVVEETTERSIDGNVHLRLNLPDGTSTWYPISGAGWEFHEDDRIDVAIHPVAWTEDQFMNDYDHAGVFSSMFADDARLESLQIYPGAELYFPGLFVRQPGNQSNLPVLRTGTIAGLPPAHERADTKTGMARVYLAEVRSIGGHSGSPVFVYLGAGYDSHGYHYDPALHMDESYDDRLDLPPMLGLIHGHFVMRPDQAMSSQPIKSADTETAYARTVDDLNSGIAAIVPASDIMHVLMQPRLLEERAEQARLFLESRGNTAPH